MSRAQRLLGVALLRLGRPGEALASFERALALAPRPRGVRPGMAAALTELGRHDEARIQRRAAEQLGSGRP